MESIGVSLRPWEDKGLLHFNTVRPTSLGMEAHLSSFHKIVADLKPTVTVVDPV